MSAVAPEPRPTSQTNGHDKSSNGHEKSAETADSHNNGGPLHPGYSEHGHGGRGEETEQSGHHGHGGHGGHRPLRLMAPPGAVAGVPPGLEYLTVIDQLLVHQQVELFEALTGIETCNRYQVKNTLGQQVYFAGEESGTCMRQCCGPQRAFVMHITDNFGQEVIRVNRDFKCFAGWNCCAGCSCCSMEIQVEAPVGQIIGFVRQRRSCLAPSYGIFDAQEQMVLTIEGPGCYCPCFSGEQDFNVFSTETGAEVGKISKQWAGFVQEFFTDADNFGVSFPMDMDARIKAILIAAVFLIDFMFYENNQQGGGGHM